MGKLNSYNFLRWEGEFEEAPFTVVANDDSASGYENAASIEIPVLDNDTATFGIDHSSVLITEQDNEDRPAVWNVSTSKLIYYVPTSPLIGIHTIKYKFRDVAGNYSNEATVSINILARVTIWKVYPPSKYCVLSGGVNNGQSGYNLLAKYYQDDQSLVSPLTTKSNVSSDPDYIAPSNDYTSCPTPAMTARLSIHNLYPSDVVISFVDLYIDGILTFTYNMNLQPLGDIDLYVVPRTYSSIVVRGSGVSIDGEIFITQVDDTTYTSTYSGSPGTGTIPTRTISPTYGADISIRPNLD